MKYEAKIDLRNHNTSHALLVELVGRDHRVLDIGCAGGDLGRVLRRRGCRVSGVEVDPAAAQAAEQVLDEVLVGDVGELDLVDHFGTESFDVVVFGDVLEHLADPLAVLRKVLPLLAGSGSVVASIPNVAHGSVRLSLLQGRFDYRPLGLLDSTHLRFFTRGSVHELLREAGLVPIDMRRTTAGIFDTEVAIRREDFDEGVVDAVVGDPDSTTYQFVFRAVAQGTPAATGARPARSSPAERCRIGVWGSFETDDIRQALVTRVTGSELARRIPGALIRSFSASTDPRPSPHDGGVPVEPLGAWSAERAGKLATELDCVVIVGDLPDPGEAEVDDGRHPARFLVEGLGRESEEECPLLWSAVRLPDGPLRMSDGGASGPSYRAVLDVGSRNRSEHDPDEAIVAVPDPLLLVPRLLRSDALARRLEFARIMGWYPQRSPALVVEMSGGLLPYAGEVARALDEAVAGSGASAVLVQAHQCDDGGSRAAEAVSAAMTASVHRVPADALVDDLVAVIANSAAFAACSSSGTALGLAYERPMAYLGFAGDPSLDQMAGAAGNLGAVVTRPGELAELLDGQRFRPAAGVVAKMQAKLDTHFDQVAAIAEAAAAARPGTPVNGGVLPPSEYVAAVELAHRRMQERLDSERRAVADQLGGLRERHDALSTERDSLDARLVTALVEVTGRVEREAALESERERAVAELEALQGIRVLRLLRPARAVYARLRGARL